jgi:hypothetical protein
MAKRLKHVVGDEQLELPWDACVVHGHYSLLYRWRSVPFVIIEEGPIDTKHYLIIADFKVFV